MSYYFKTEKYDKDFLSENMMGPNPMLIVEELTQNVTLKKGMRVLDLGCGKGLSSIFLAEKFGVQVFAVDLWVSATDNLKRFKQMEIDDLIIPIHSDALKLPFADGYFDAVISVDAYHYFGNNDHYFDEKLKPILKKGAIVALAFPGMKYEVHDAVPVEMMPYWEEEALEMWHSIDWWKPKFEKSLSDFHIKEMQCFDKAWNDWLSTENPYAIEDRAMINADGGRYMNIIGLIGKLI
ncbi:SAM-dependent methyltransferase [Alkalibacterium sp. f15]|uniref:SAM-dependent methyltransferase n=1 Tax=Alkalibacterium sp. f15 TaxID=3414029 RepID=UPI003BF7D968